MKRVPLAWVWVPQNLGPGGVEVSEKLPVQANRTGAPSFWSRLVSVLSATLLGVMVATIAVFNYRTLLSWVWHGLNIPVGLQAVLLLALTASILVRFHCGRSGVIGYAAAYLATMYFFDSFPSESQLLIVLSSSETTWIFNNASYIVVIAGTALAVLPLLPPNSWFNLRPKTPSV